MNSPRYTRFEMEGMRKMATMSPTQDNLWQETAVNAWNKYKYPLYAGAALGGAGGLLGGKPISGAAIGLGTAGAAIGGAHLGDQIGRRIGEHYGLNPMWTGLAGTGIGALGAGFLGNKLTKSIVRPTKPSVSIRL